MAKPPDAIQALSQDLDSMRYDPLRYVCYAYPWGGKGSGLELESGPRAWQRRLLKDLGDSIRLRPHDPIRISVRSGNGVGKSCLISWVLDWSMATCRNCKVVVTANTEPQLRTKTWPEVAKWHGLSVVKPFFKLTAMGMASTDERYERTWRADALPWSEERTESFSGLHNKGSRLVMIFDESSSIPDTIWEAAEGVTRDEGTEIIWLVCGNPTRQSGRFRDCFGRLSNRWKNYHVDSTTVEGVNQEELKRLIEDYGADSDYARVFVRGEFPLKGMRELIPAEVVRAAVSRPLPDHGRDEPLILGVDVARFGSDASCLCFRRGFDARSIPMVKATGIDLMELVSLVASNASEHEVDMVFVDEGGLGAGVVDRLRELGVECMGVNFGWAADNPGGQELCFNKRAEMWVRTRDWLKRGGCIPDDPLLTDGLSGVEMTYAEPRNSIQLERKELAKKRGVRGLDEADALALSWAFPVMPVHRSVGSDVADTAYDPFACLDA